MSGRLLAFVLLLIPALALASSTAHQPFPGGLLLSKVRSRLEDFNRAGRLLIRYARGTSREALVVQLGLEDIGPGLVGDQVICEWRGRMTAVRLNHIAQTPGVLSVEVFEVDGGG